MATHRLSWFAAWFSRPCAGVAEALPKQPDATLVLHRDLRAHGVRYAAAIGRQQVTHCSGAESLIELNQSSHVQPLRLWSRDCANMPANASDQM
jgi:hypothetical protein